MRISRPNSHPRDIPTEYRKRAIVEHGEWRAGLVNDVIKTLSNQRPGLAGQTSHFNKRAPLRPATNIRLLLHCNLIISAYISNHIFFGTNALHHLLHISRVQLQSLLTSIRSSQCRNDDFQNQHHPHYWCYIRPRRSIRSKILRTWEEGHHYRPSTTSIDSP